MLNNRFDNIYIDNDAIHNKLLNFPQNKFQYNFNNKSFYSQKTNYN